jgi:phosphoadenosine phosphosulfate reductase
MTPNTLPAEIEVTELAARFRQSRPEHVLRWASETFGSRVKLASSFAGESVVLIDMIYRVAPDIGVVTIDTGRLPEETFELMNQVRDRYQINIEVVTPDQSAIEELVTQKGPYSFRLSVENRLECCRIRKVEPARRALKGLAAWITGIRRDQSESRSSVEVVEWDSRYGLLKLNPLAFWNRSEVWKYIDAHGVPYNQLYDRGYSSIGCACCTRAILPGEDARSGRWWWELESDRECGMHAFPSSRS